MSYTYNSAILGGTFDHFHSGHEKFIDIAFRESQDLTIGIVKQFITTNKYRAEGIEKYSTRLSNLRSYLKKRNVESRAKIISISDIYGTSLTDKNIEAIFVTDSTKSNAEIINIKRRELGLTPLAVVIVPFELSDDGNIISSSRIRQGEIDRKGRSYRQFFLQQKSYLLPNHLRESLKHPLGRVVSSTQELQKLLPPTSSVISIGDIVSLGLKDIGFLTSVSIIDYKTRRVEIKTEVIKRCFPIINQEITNPAGVINTEIANILSSSLAEFQKTKVTQVIAVDGEEDLLALPSMLLSPLGTYIVYGQYEVGIILLEVTEQIKSIAKKYLKQFN
jgi:pantetheine-phosphate adenylyltransferase